MTRKTSYPELAHWIKEQRAAQRDLEATTEDAARWLERARLAQRANNTELWDIAKQKMDDVRAQHQRANARWQEATAALHQLRAQPEKIADKEAQFAEELLVAFELMGIDPEQTALEDALAHVEIQQRIEEMKREALIGDDLDPLALLKQRLNQE